MENQLRPTNVRYLVVASATLMAVLLYLDRFCISMAEIYIKEDLGLTDGQIGWMLSAFFWTYALGQVPAGWMTDRFGARIMLTVYVLSWSLFTGLTGFAGSFTALLLLRFGFGFAQAGAYPTAASIVSKWVPFRSRGTVSGIISVGGRIGGWLALFATGYLLVWLTPANTPVHLQATDILNGPQLCFELTDSENPDNGLRQQALANFDDEARQMVDRYAALYKADQQQSSNAATGNTQATSTPIQFSPDDASTLATQLNRFITSNAPTSFDAVQGEGLKLELAAQRLLKLDATKRTEAESETLHRFVLEALHRNCIKKLYVAGWRPMMRVYGVIGIFVAILIWWTCRKSPAHHARCNAAEVQLITQDQPMKTDGKVDSLPLLELMGSLSMWLCCATQWFTNIGWVFLMTWAPRYFMDAHDLSIEKRALYVSIPPLVGWAGMLCGGAITDVAVRFLGLRWGRAIPMGASRFFAMAAYIGCLFHPSPLVAVILFSVVAFSTDFGTPSIWAYNQDVGGKYVGSVLGWGNMWGNLGAAIAPPLLIFVIGESRNWNYAFIACAVSFFVSGLAGLGVNATIPITRPGKDTDATGSPETDVSKNNAAS
ncbi:MAG TPA: MFS transporter [Planctomycetaceae bacterium]|nr:MFS transporter [Blastopirellula sp.]HAY80930.1 MFS transporter [Planctomycetaceae bacterium]